MISGKGKVLLNKLSYIVWMSTQEISNVVKCGDLDLIRRHLDILCGKGLVDKKFFKNKMLSFNLKTNYRKLVAYKKTFNAYKI